MEIGSIPCAKKLWVMSSALIFPQVFLQLGIIPITAGSYSFLY